MAALQGLIIIITWQQYLSLAGSDIGMIIIAWRDYWLPFTFTASFTKITLLMMIEILLIRMT